MTKLILNIEKKNASKVSNECGKMVADYMMKMEQTDEAEGKDAAVNYVDMAEMNKFMASGGETELNFRDELPPELMGHL